MGVGETGVGEPGPILNYVGFLSIHSSITGYRTHSLLHPPFRHVISEKRRGGRNSENCNLYSLLCPLPHAVPAPLSTSQVQAQAGIWSMFTICELV